MYNICFTIANVSKTGGEERMCVLLANELSSLGHDITIVSQNNYYWQKPIFKIDSRIKIRSMKRTLVDWTVCRLFRRLRFDLWKYRRILKRQGIQLIIDVDTEVSLDSSIAKKGLDIKLISWEHFCFQRFKEREISSAIIECIKSNADKLVVLTKADQTLFRKCCGIPENKIVQLYNPSPIERNEFICHNGKKVLAMGRLENEKGYDMLLKAWATVEKEASDWCLEIVGEGSQRESLISLCDSLGLQQVNFMPFTDNPYEKYLDASIYALSSRHEGFPLALLESANMSLPVVAFDCPNGPGEIVVDGVNGYLVEPGNVELFAEKLLSLIKDSDMRERFSRNALETVKDLKISGIIKKWENLISSVVDGKGNLNS